MSMQLFRKIQLQAEAFMGKVNTKLTEMEKSLEDMNERLKVMESKLPATSKTSKKKKGIN